MVENVQIGKRLSKMIFKMFKNGQKWLRMVNNSKKWQQKKRGRNGQ